MSALGPLAYLRTVDDVVAEGDVDMLVGAGRQLLAGLARNRGTFAPGFRSAARDSLALLAAIVDRLRELLVSYRPLSDDEFAALIAAGRVDEAERRVWADVDATARDLQDVRHDVAMRQQARALGLAS